MKIETLRIKDFCVIGSGEVAMADQGLVLISGENRDSESADSNGSGKTTIFKALTWCLTGQTIDGDKADTIIRQGAAQTEVSTVLFDGAERWTVTRIRGKREILSLSGPEGEVVESKELLQARIEKLLGFDFHAFKSTVLYGQEDSSRFANRRTQDGQRKDVIHRILRTGLLKKCEKWARNQAKAIKESMVPVETEVGNAKAALDEYDVEDLRESESEWEARKKTKKTRLKDQMKQMRAAAKKAKARLSRIPGDVKELDREIQALGLPEEGVEDVQFKIGKLLDNQTKIVAVEATCQAQIDGLNKQLSRLQGDTCPVCTSDLTDGDAAEHIVSSLARLANKESKLVSVEGMKAKCSASISKSQKLAAKYRKQVKEKSELISDRKDLVAEEKSLKRDLASQENALKSVKASFDEEEDEENPWTSQRIDVEKRVKVLEKRLKLGLDKLKKIESELAHFQFWVKGFSAQGLPSFVLDSAMPLLTERSNHYLETLADGDIILEFSTRTKLKSGDERDKINITWVIEGSEGTTPSRGQERKMEVATDLALMDLAETREGGSVDLLLLDEVLDGLDAAGRSRVIDLLHELRAKRKSIFVISHDPLMAEVFEKVVTVVKESQIATIEVAS